MRDGPSCQEVVDKVAVVMAMDVGHLARVLLTLRLVSQLWYMLLVAARRVTHLMS